MEDNQKIIAEKVVADESDIMVSPYEYFQKLKEKVQEMDDEKLNETYKNALYLAEQYNRTGQKKGLRKLIFHLESIIKERDVLKCGINKYVYKSDIEYYIDNVASKQVVILDLASYERSIPEDVIEAMEKVKGIFDEFYVVCTDYNGKMSKQVQKERREKDPILFGAFLDRDRQAINERFYYIGDWVDEYCDLTLEKMVAEMKSVNKTDILKEISSSEMPENTESLKSQLNKLNIKEEDLTDGTTKLTLISSDSDLKPKKSFFDKVKTFLGVKND